MVEKGSAESQSRSLPYNDEKQIVFIVDFSALSAYTWVFAHGPLITSAFRSQLYEPVREQLEKLALVLQ